MSQVPNFTLPLPLSPEQQAQKSAAAAQQAPEPAKIGLWPAVVAGLPTADVFEGFRSTFQTIDQSFLLDPKRMDQLTAGLDRDLWPAFVRAQNPDDAQSIRERMMEIQLSRTKLSQAGAAAHVASIGGSIIDPVNAALMLSTGGLGTAAKLGGMEARLAAAARNGLIAGGINASTTAAQSLVNPTVDGDTVVRSGLTGFGFGSGAGLSRGMNIGGRFVTGAGAAAAPGLAYDVAGNALGLHNRTDADVAYAALESALMGGIFNLPNSHPAIREMNERLEPIIIGQLDNVNYTDAKALAQATGHTISETLTPAGQKLHAERIAADAAQAAANAEAPTGVRVSIGAASPQELASIEAHNARRAEWNKPRLGTDLFVTDPTDAHAMYGGARFSMVSYVSDSPLPDVRKAANVVFSDALPKVDGRGGAQVMSWVESRRAALAGRANIETENAHATHIKYAIDNGLTPMTAEQFRTASTRAVRRDPALITDPGIKQAIAQDDAAYIAAGRMRLRHGVNGWDQFEFRPGYRPVIYDPEAVLSMVKTYGEDQVIRVISNAIKARSATIDSEMADIIAGAVVKRQTGKLFGNERLDATILDGDPEQLRDAIKHYAPGISEAKVDAIIYDAGGLKDSEAGKSPRARRRIDMDHALETPVLNQKTGITDPLSVEAMTVQDSVILRHAYEAQGVHESALATTLQSLTNHFEQPAKTIPEYLRRLQKQGEDASKGTLTQAQRADLVQDLHRLEVGLNSIAGLSNDKNPGLAAAARTLNQVNFVRLMGGLGTGMQNLADMGSVLGQTGIRMAIEECPHILNIVRLFRDSKTGQVNTPLLRQLETWGVGMERAARKPVARMSTVDGSALTTNRGELWLAKASNFTADIGGQAPGTRWMQLTTGELMVQKWAEHAFQGRALSPTMLQMMDIDPAMLKRINEGLKNPAVAVTGKSMFGNTRIRSVDIEAFSRIDNEAAARFVQAIVTESRRLVQVNDPTQYAAWMNSELGRVATNLQRYNVVAWEGKTLRKGAELRNGEYAQVASTLLATSLASIALYTARTYYQSIGRPDRDKFLQERLSHSALYGKDGALWSNGVGRADYMSLLPGVIDIPFGLLKEQGPFAYKSSSGRRASLVEGIPAVNLGDTVLNAAPIPFMGLTPRKQISRGEFHNAEQLVPDYLNVRNGLEWWARTFPKSNDQGKP